LPPEVVAALSDALNSGHRAAARPARSPDGSSSTVTRTTNS
jgi:hypothetical protein